LAEDFFPFNVAPEDVAVGADKQNKDLAYQLHAHPKLLLYKKERSKDVESFSRGGGHSDNSKTLCAWFLLRLPEFVAKSGNAGKSEVKVIL
jgi:hypothetical protein